jgi:hypothetical protein
MSCIKTSGLNKFFADALIVFGEEFKSTKMK